MGCIACRVSMGIVNTYCSIHHVDGRTKPHAHWYVLPLCAGHHQNGYGGAGFTGVAVHPYKARFEAEYGTQSDLLSKCARSWRRRGTTYRRGSSHGWTVARWKHDLYSPSLAAQQQHLLPEHAVRNADQ
ncbi:Ref family recombination enhancement nuclease [Pseudomonas aeruginosa]